MKKQIILLSTLLLSFLAFAGHSSNTLAAESNEEATATFELVAPSDPLKITEATDLTFENAVISATDIVSMSSTDAKVTIEELSGNAPGWQLSAKLGDFIGTTNKKTLIGAKVFYPSINPETTNAGDSSSVMPKSISTDAAFQGSKKGVILTAGSDAVNIVTADSGKGYGGWTMDYPEGDVQLKVPAGNLKDTYTATLTYTLIDAPK